MLTALLVKQFQRHKRLELKLDPGITVITGSTDRGKSALVRALTWVVLNEPEGDQFITHGKDSATVGLRVDGRTILRKRSRSSNLYKLDGKEFKALRGAVPPEIEEVLKMSPLNFQAQHDSPFWFSASPPEVSRRLNQVIDLSIIDEALARVASRVRHANAVVDVTTQRKDKAKAEKKELAFVPELDADVHAVEELHQSAVRTRDEIATLGALIAEAEQAQKLAKVELPDFSATDALRREMRKAEDSIDLLRSLIESAEDSIDEVRKLHNELAELEAQIHKTTKGRCPLCGGKFNE